MAATLSRLWVYPVKGFSGTSLASTRLGSHGIPDDRSMAFAFKDCLSEGVQDLSRYPWTSKAKLAVQNDWPGLAALRLQMPELGKLSLRDLAGRVQSWDIRQAAERESISRFVSDYLKSLTPSTAARHPEPTEVALVGEPGPDSRYPDRQSEHISLLSLATLRSLSEELGKQVDVDRFRGNLIVDGLDAWAEASWAEKKFAIGEAEIEATKLIVRCHNINVNQETGEADLDLLAPLKALTERKTGHRNAIFGIMARVLKPGKISQGDSLIPLS